jgi:outer membrane immunogenic protein
MKKAVLVGISLAAMGTGTATAFAADLSAPMYTKARLPVAPYYSWAGFYLGLNGGGASSRNCWDLTARNVAGTVTPVSPAVREGCHDATGGLVGGQIGYRWQASTWVFGVEAQGDWANLKASNLSAPLAFGSVLTNRTKIDAIGLFTGQIGYAWNNVLWYGKGGAALSHDKYTGITTASGLGFDQASETRWGGAVGTGVEIGFAPGWSVAAEYDHLFMGSRSLNFGATGTNIFTRTDNIKQDVDMGTVRVNYTFGAPLVARY